MALSRHHVELSNDYIHFRVEGLSFNRGEVESIHITREEGADEATFIIETPGGTHKITTVAKDFVVTNAPVNPFTGAEYDDSPAPDGKSLTPIADSVNKFKNDGQEAAKLDIRGKLEKIKNKDATEDAVDVYSLHAQAEWTYEAYHKPSLTATSGEAVFAAMQYLRGIS